MSEQIHALAQQLFDRPSVEACDLQEVKNLAERYPYFAPAQFLLLEKLKQENDPGYTAQLQKAVLYYHNPLEFEYFISANKFFTEVNFDTPVPEIETAAPHKEEVSETPEVPAPVIETEEEPEAFAAESGSHETETLNEQEPEIKLPEAPAKEEEVIPVEEISEPVAVEPEQNNSNEIQTPQPAGKVPEPEPLSFEPYHTVDYFASQGIKLSQEEVPKDKFGKQLKSFTEWLKTMKRIPASEISKTADLSSEANVQHLAEGSVHDANVVTEAMAEVWVKQGNRQKAIETYNKLGLLNPSKKAYFADKIENLKRF
jgi:hypothetical protein